MIEFCNNPDPCPIRLKCLLYALMNNCAEGVWGGMSPEDRQAMRRKYPLGMGTRGKSGLLEYHPNPHWRWLPPGEGTALLAAPGGKLDAEDDRAGISS